MGTQTESFVELTERIGRKTGGLSVYPLISPLKDSPEPVAYLMLRGKAMADKAGDLLDLFRDVLLSARLDDYDRFKQAMSWPAPSTEHSTMATEPQHMAAVSICLRLLRGMGQVQHGSSGSAVMSS
jgi:Zn-dependent M16 (insulinase) family peptidase